MLHTRDDTPNESPPPLQSLVEEGLIDSVVRQHMSGKEAMVFVVRCGDETRCAKVYKEATQRSFRQAVDYTENRKVKNTRKARAMWPGVARPCLRMPGNCWTGCAACLRSEARWPKGPAFPITRS